MLTTTTTVKVKIRNNFMERDFERTFTTKETSVDRIKAIVGGIIREENFQADVENCHEVLELTITTVIKGA